MTRVGDWMQTYSGTVFWPLDPCSLDVSIVDISHALSNMCRYAGHCREFYSVAQHSVLVSRACPDHLKLWGLMHDAPEAYVVDVPRPLKRFLVGYEAIERGVMDAIVDAFGMHPLTMPQEVKRIDNAILADESAQIMATPPRDWCLPEPPLGINIEPWSPHTARRLFLDQFEKLVTPKEPQ